jgi:hypothetical protein
MGVSTKILTGVVKAYDACNAFLIIVILAPTPI